MYFCRAECDKSQNLNIEALYQEYKNDVTRTLNHESTARILQQTKQITKYLDNHISSNSN